MRGHHEDDTMTMEFDLEDRPDSVVESTKAWGIIGPPGASLPYVPKVYSNNRNLWQSTVEHIWLMGRGSFF